MRPLFLLPLLLAAAPAHASHLEGPPGTPPGFEFIMPTSSPTSGRPFYVEIHRAGQWDTAGLHAQAIANGNTLDDWIAYFNVSLDGQIIFTSTLASFNNSQAGYGQWDRPLGWGLEVPGLQAGIHEFVATYAGDTGNPPVESTFSFLVHPYQFTLNPPRRPKPLEPRPGTDPDVSPAGFVFLTDEETGAVAVVDIATLLVTDPDTGRPTLNLSSLQGDTVVSYPGDANFPAFNFTYNAPDTPVPAPAAPFALALAVLAVARWRGAALPLSSVGSGPFRSWPASR